jgi:hypothetical protein
VLCKDRGLRENKSEREGQTKYHIAVA